MAAEITCPDPATLLLLRMGHIPEPHATELRRHLSSCPQCSYAPRSAPDDTPKNSPVAPCALLSPDGWDSSVPTGQVQPAALPIVEDDSRPDDEEILRLILRPPQGPNELGRLGGYRVLRILGQGGMGLIFEAEDIQLGRRVALKVIRPDQSETDLARQRFLQEARAVAVIEHDHIVTIYQVGEENNVLYLAMQLLQGESLADRLRREHCLPIDEVIRIARQTAEGLFAAHARGLIHRDIKPANIFLEQVPGKALSRVKVLDFGLARFVGGGNTVMTQAGLVVGTPGYMAPEQARSQPLDARCDLFSLGCVMHRIASGEEPFKGETPLNVLVALTVDAVPLLTELRSEVPASLAALVQRLLAKAPEGRPASAAVVAEELAAIEHDRAMARADRRPAPPPVPKPPPPQSEVEWKSLPDRARPAALPSVPKPPPLLSETEWKSLPNRPQSAASPPTASKTPTVPDNFAEEARSQPGVCGQCGGDYRVFGGRRWCLRCGTCHEADLKKNAAPAPVVAEPHWLFLLAAGCLLIVTSTIFACCILPAGSVALTWWIRVEMAVGVCGCFAGYAWLLVATVRDRTDERIVQFVNPVSLWRYAFAYLPQTRRSFYFGGWGVTAILCALVLNWMN